LGQSLRLPSEKNYMSKKGMHWPVGIIMVYGLFFIALLIMLIFALNRKSDLVEQDYYRKGIQYQQQIDRIEYTKAAREKLSWKYSKANNQLIIQFPESNTSGTILLYCPSDAGADRSYSISPSDSARQIIDLSDFKKGLWKLKINWQIKNYSYYNEEILVIDKN
jgi:hypothetical protein